MIEYIAKKLDAMDDKLDKVHEQAVLTNGRVTRLENDSVGRWIKTHIPTFIVALILFFAMVISDFRHPIVNGLLTLLGLF